MPINQNAIIYIAKRYEEKLAELMGKEDFYRFTTEVARETFRAEIESMAPSDFRDFCLQNFEKITGTDAEEAE